MSLLRQKVGRLMEVKIHKMVFGGTTLAALKVNDIINIDGYKWVGDMSFDGDNYYYFIFERDIDPNECFDAMEDVHVWQGMAKAGESCKCGNKVFQINYIGPSGEKPTDFTKGPVS